MWAIPRFSADLVTLTEKILNENFTFFVQWQVEMIKDAAFKSTDTICKHVFKQ